MKRLLISLPTQILIGIIASLLMGIFAHESVHYVAWLGTIFLRLLTMLVVPLILFLVSGAICSNKLGTIGRLGIKTVAFYMVTTLLAILCGLMFVTLLKPGMNVNLGLGQEIPAELLENAKKPLTDILLDIIPSNIFAAMAGCRVLPVLFFAVLLGISLSTMKGENAAFLRQGIQATGELMMRLTSMVIRLAPIGVFAMVADRIGSFGGEPALLTAVNVYGDSCCAVSLAQTEKRFEEEPEVRS